MGGKSSYCRTVALQLLLAQMGSFVPASRSEITVVDAILSRVGAGDSTQRAQSTFMVEMLGRFKYAYREFSSYKCQLQNACFSSLICSFSFHFCVLLQRRPPSSASPLATVSSSLTSWVGAPASMRASALRGRWHNILLRLSGDFACLRHIITN
jgi:hypothetical protein